MFWGTIGGRGTPTQVVATGSDFAAGTIGGDFSTGYVNVYDATVSLLGTDDGSSIGPSGSIISASFGQAASTLPRFTGDQVTVSPSIPFSAGAVSTTSNSTLFQTFNPAFANGYILAFYTSTGVNYRILVSASALLTAATLSNVVRLEFRWGTSQGMAITFNAGGIATYSDNGTAGSNQSAATIPTGTYTATASQLLFLEKIAVVP